MAPLITEPAPGITEPEGGADVIGVAPTAAGLEKRGRHWLVWSFLLCPCHLPLSLGVLSAVLAGTSVGAAVRDHAWVAGTLITLTWLAGTGYGFHLIRRAQRAGGACPVRTRP